MSLGENIRRFRSQMGISQDALAEKLGVARQSISKWERDAATPELEKLMAMAELFGVTLDELVKMRILPVTLGDMKSPRRTERCLRRGS